MKQSKILLTLILSFLAFQNLFAQLSTQVNCVSGSIQSYSISALSSNTSFIPNYTKWYVYYKNIEINRVSNRSKKFTYVLDVNQRGSGTFVIKAEFVDRFGKVITEFTQPITLTKTDFTMQGRPDDNLILCESDPHLAMDTFLISTIDPWHISSSVEIYSTTNFGVPPNSAPIMTRSVPSYIVNSSDIYYVIPKSVFNPGTYYYIKVTTNNSCFGTKNIVKYLYLDPTCRIGNNSNSVETINYTYPNPVQDYLNFNDDASSVEKVIVNDIMGKNVKTFNNPMSNSIDLSGLEAGVYNVVFYKTNGEVIVKKVSKK